MSYFDDQYDAWMDSGCQGEITEINPSEYYADKIDACRHKFVKKVCKKCGLQNH